MRDILFQSAEAHAAQLIKKLAYIKVVAERTQPTTLRAGEIEYIAQMVYQVQDVEKNIQILRRRVAERKAKS